MGSDGLVQFFFEKILELWDDKDNPEIQKKIIEYLTKIEIYSSDPLLKAEIRRTKSILKNEKQKVSPFNSQHLTETSEDLPIRVEDLVVIEKPSVTFDQIGGLEDVKETLKLEVIYPYLYPEKYELYGRSPGNGVLLWGPPGCGKTMLAKAIARESDIDVFLAPKASDIMNRWVGQSEKIIAAIFNYARTFEKAVLFFDEVDYIAPRAGPSYMMRIKRELLIQMDGISSKKTGLLVFGATNRPWLLDPAIRRPAPQGVRFSKTILVPPPDFEARKEIFRIHLSKLKPDMLSPDVDLNELAKITHGYSGADIGAIVEAAIDIPLKEYIAGKTPRPVTMADFYVAIKNQPKSILPWLSEALKAVQRYNEEHLATQLLDLARKYGFINENA